MQHPLLLLLAAPALALQPAESATRTIIPLDGVWRLTVNNRSLAIAVPSSFDELVEGLPEGYSGPAVYHREFRVPAAFRGQRLVLRFDSANYRAAVRVDSVLLTTHEFAGMPFEAELPASAADAGVHTLSVTVDVARSWQTLPPGLPATHYGVPVVLTWDGLYGFGGLDGPFASSRCLRARLSPTSRPSPRSTTATGRRRASPTRSSSPGPTPRASPSSPSSPARGDRRASHRRPSSRRPRA